MWSEHLECPITLVYFWEPETLWEVMSTCVIIHNMIMEDECNQAHNLDSDYVESLRPSTRTD